MSTISIADAVTAICERAGLSASQFDVTDLSSITTELRSMAISTVTPARQVLEMLMGAFFFEAVLSDKIYFRPRAGSAALTLAYDDLGYAAFGDNAADPLALTVANELEIPAQVALTYSNVDADHQADTQYSDRLLTGMESTSAVQLPIGLTAAEAKAIADALLMDQAVAALSTTLHLSLAYTRLEPTDVVLATGSDGSVYRLRLVKRTEEQGVIKFDAVLDDSTVFTQAGTTAGGTTPQTVVAALPDTTLELLDIPILRDDDDHPGIYTAVKGSDSTWRSAAIYHSLDGTTYTNDTTVSSEAVIGTCTTTLGSWSGGNVFDFASSVTVDVGDGTLASYTHADVLAGLAPGYLVGSEIIMARTATLVSPGVYTLSDLLRGRRGTEWASTGHTASERFVALSTSGLRVMTLNAGDLARLRYYKAASAGQLLSAVTAETITPVGIGLMPFSPVDLRADRTSTDTVLSAKRRSRLSCRLVGALPIYCPLGEASESWEWDVYSDGTYTTIKRTLTSSTGSVTYTLAQQTTDFGGAQTVVYAKVYQLSATVGRGYALTASA